MSLSLLLQSGPKNLNHTGVFLLSPKSKLQFCSLAACFEEEGISSVWFVYSVYGNRARLQRFATELSFSLDLW